MQNMVKESVTFKRVCGVPADAFKTGATGDVREIIVAVDVY